MVLSKQKKEINSKIDPIKEYALNDAVKMLKDFKYVKFDETIELAINLGVDPRHADQNIRVSTTLPHGTGKEIKVLVFAQGPKEKEAKDAGADFVGKEFFDKLKSGWDDIDTIVATPDMMQELGKLGKVLGPKGLMPNPKSGTVTMDIKKAVNKTNTTLDNKLVEVLFLMAFAAINRCHVLFKLRLSDNALSIRSFNCESLKERHHSFETVSFPLKEKF